MGRNRVIWKFPLEVTDVQDIIARKGYKILSLAVQDILKLGPTPCLWILVDPEEEVELIRVVTFCTGQPLTEQMVMGMTFVGTYLIHLDDFVGHVFVGEME